MRKRKILVLSLLRLGDIILATPVLRGLREREPTAEIHILINSQFAQIAELIPYVDRVLLFERDQLQKGLAHFETGLFEPADRLRKLVGQLNDEGYQQVINLTQNRLSGYLLKMIDGAERVGLCLDSAGRAGFGSPWFRYLNTQAEADSEAVFHFTDVFRFGLGLDRIPSSPLLTESQAGNAEAEAILGTDQRPVLLVQPLSSDVKKDWGLPSFREMLAIFAFSHPNHRILVLGAPNEATRLQPLVDDLSGKGIDARLAICSLAGAFSLLRRAAALVTVDTSIKHLACAARTKLVELVLGSSDPNRTGAYFQNSVIIRSREACAPCVHSKPCHRERQFCVERVSPEAVAMVVGEVVTGDLHQLRIIAEEYRDELDILRVETEASGHWTAWSVLEPFTEASVGRYLSLSGVKAQLEEERLKAAGGWGEMGTETVRLERLLRKVHPDIGTEEWLGMLSGMERQAMLVESRIDGLQTGLRSLYGTYEDRERMRQYVSGLIAFREKLKTQPFLQASKSSLDDLIEDEITPAFTRFRRIVDALQEIRVRTGIELKLIRNLMNRMEGEL